jgi:putative ABC transport system permease protein
MMRAISAATLLLRRIRGEAGVLLMLFVLVGATSFLFSAAPRIFNSVTDDALRYAVSTALPTDRDVLLNAIGTIGAGRQGGVSAIREYADERRSEFAPTLNSVITQNAIGVTSVRMTVDQSITDFFLRYQDDVVDQSQLIDGRWPVDRGAQLKQTFFGQPPGGSAQPAIFEIAMSKSEADVIGAHLGDQFSVNLDKGDSLVPTTSFGLQPTKLELVGLFEPNDPTGDQWNGSGLLEPSFKRDMTGISAIYATGLIAPETYPALAASTLPFRYDWRYSIDPGRLNADSAASLQPDLKRLDLVATGNDRRSLPESASTAALTNVAIRTGLLHVLDKFDAQRARSESVLSIAALGPLVLATGAIAMLAVLLIRPRRGSLLLARGRGATGALLLGVQLIEALLIAGTAALLGWALATLVVPARDAPLSPILAAIVASISVLLLVAATWPAAQRPLTQLERDDPAVLRVSARRLVLEAAIVGLAVLAIVLLRQRGLTVGDVDQTVQFDPLLAAVPILCGIAAGIVLMRLYPLPIRALGRLAARRRDFVAVNGLRTVARRPASANLPLLVLMIAAAFGAFASVVESSIDRGQVAASYLDVGADYRLEAEGLAGLPATLNPATIPDVNAVASGFVDQTAAYVSSAKQRAGINLIALNGTALADVTARTAAASTWPDAFTASPSAVGVGTPSNPIPAIVSDDFPPGTDNLGPGSTFTISVARQNLTFKLIERRSSVAGLAVPQNFAIVPLDWITATEAGKDMPVTEMWVRASDDVAAPLEQMVSETTGGIRIISRHDAYSLLHDAPLGSAVADGYGIALSVAVLYLVMVLVGAVIISAAGRSRDIAYMRTLGVSVRQARALTAVENAPPIMLALIPGVLLGVLVASIVQPGLGLSDFTGAEGLPLFVDWSTLIVVIVVLSAVVFGAILLGTWLAGKTRLTSALRIEDS